jgi:hypothetical protein
MFKVALLAKVLSGLPFVAQDPVLWVNRTEIIPAINAELCHQKLEDWVSVVKPLPLKKTAKNATKNTTKNKKNSGESLKTLENILGLKRLNPTDFKTEVDFSEASEAIQDCDDFPCDVKLSQDETKIMKSTQPSNRLKVFRDLILKRVQSSVRDEFESGKRVDLKQWFLNRPELKDIFTSGSGWEESSVFYQGSFLGQRVLKLNSDRMKPTRQIFKVSLFREGDQMILFSQDLYSSHFFDGWADIVSLSCDRVDSQLGVTQSLVVDFDLLKNTDLLSSIAKPQMRDAIRTQGMLTLEENFKKFKSNLKLVSTEKVPEKMKTQKTITEKTIK